METLNWKEVVSILLALYEIIVRIFPTVKNYSIVSWIVKFLGWLDSALNNRKK